MQRKRETTPSRQANRVALKSKHSLTQAEWESACYEMAPGLMAMFALLFAVMTGVL